ncbi:MAG: RluA family pseudouridine synthase [Xanthomonadaceae bacterium]|nr:RluA family pseudouridine synthase [Xanthomonadaceae bacterium]
MSSSWKHTLDRDEHESRLDHIVPKLFTEQNPGIPITRSRFQNWIDEGLVKVNGEVARSSVKVSAGDTIEIFIPPSREMSLSPIPMNLEILYEDEHLAIINKPPGISVHPSDTDTGPTLVHGLLHHFGKLSQIGGVYRPGIIHRLDKYTSGSLVITKTDQAHQKLAEVFAKHDIERVYWAICYGAPIQTDMMKIQTQLGRHPADRKKIAVLPTGGKTATTYAQSKQRYAEPGKSPFGSWMECRLETGRTHQVRVHLNHLKLPIMGDQVYGTPRAVPPRILEKVRNLTGQALHARTIGFAHPITGVSIKIDAEPHQHFRDLLLELKTHYVSG